VKPGPERLLCDVMLIGLGRWLRAAGHDVLFAGPQDPDEKLLAMAEEAGRRLLTADRLLAKRARRALLLPATGLDEQAARLSERIGLDWLQDPFSRCLLDNTLLQRLPPEQIEAVPDRARTLPGPFNRCPSCGRIFWPGSHVRRMQARLETWQKNLRSRPASVRPTPS
jgi:uncharacterized protein with PIN domain